MMSQEQEALRVRTRHVVLAFALGVILVFISYIRILGDAGSAAFHNKIIDAAIAGPIWGTALGDELLSFAITQLLTHISFAFCCLGLARASLVAWPKVQATLISWTVLWFVLGTAWLLIANAAYFPWSSLGNPYADLGATTIGDVKLITMLTGLSALAVLTTSGLALWRWLESTSHRRAALLVGATAALSLGMALVGVRISVASGPVYDQPNIIVIGLDSLRTDALAQSPSITPRIDEFLAPAVKFSDATTPLARTFPSWTSIISGKHPHTTGAVMNLLPREMIRTGDTLPQLLGKAGYRSIYAIDEVRFSNLDTSYGFDTMIAPPIGAADFLLGFFADTPLSNLVANTWMGRLLYPYTHANRAVAHAYDPDTFIELLDRELEFDQSTFLAVHLTLAHWPFNWADAPIAANTEGKSAARHLYDPAVSRLDQQFGDLIDVLEQRGALRNAIVIVLSDHGESLGTVDASARALQAKPVEYEEERLTGHGTSVFSRHQYEVVLALRSFGKTPLPALASHTIDMPVSLEDITPTLVDLFDIPTDDRFDGISFLPLLAAGPLQPPRTRIRFTETEFNPQGVLTGQVVSASALFTAAEYYRVDPSTDRVLIRTERLAEIMGSRQYAAFMEDRMLALIPSNTPTGIIHKALYMQEGAAPTPLPDPAASDQRHTSELWAALRKRFPTEFPTMQVREAIPSTKGQ